MSTITKKMKQIVRVGQCRCCGCTAMNCAGCVERTGDSCRWVNPQQDLCSACICDGCGLDANGAVEPVHTRVPGITPAAYANDPVNLCSNCRMKKCPCTIAERDSGHRVGCWFPGMQAAIAKAEGGA